MRHLPVVFLLLFMGGCGNSSLDIWHRVNLDEEFTAQDAGKIDSFAAYLELESRLYAQLDREVYAHTPRGPDYRLSRYSAGSAADPRDDVPDWNRSFELKPDSPRGGVLLLHGMSDSPYSLRALGETLHQRGYQVLGLRLPGHGTAPSALTRVRWQDMAAAVDLAMTHLAGQLGDRPIHIIAYSTGAPLALHFSLEAEQGRAATMPASLVLISPAIGVSPAAALASWKRRLSLVPGLENLAWLSIEPEFDPYKYNSFATNAGEQVYRLTRSVAGRLQARVDEGRDTPLPPTLVLKSTVDATVSTRAVVDRLLKQLSARRHELVLFDINRLAIAAPLLVSDPGPLTRQLLEDDSLPFALTLVGNENEQSRELSISHRAPFAGQSDRVEALGMSWPRGIVSLSHVALPFSPRDPLYGAEPPEQKDRLFLGQIPLRGERGLLKISSDWLLRLRHNPFYDYLEQRSLDWVETH